MPVIKVSKEALSRLIIDNPIEDGDGYRIVVDNELFAILTGLIGPDESYSNAILKLIAEHEDKCSQQKPKQ